MGLFSQHADAPAPAGPLEVDVQTAYSLQQQGAQLIDVRVPDEFAQVHAKGARSIPLGQLARRAGEIEPNRVVLLICRSGSRCRTAQDLLARSTITDTRNVRGGTNAWRIAGLPLE